MLQNLDATTVAIISASVVGLVELVRRLFAKDWQAAVTIIGAAILGGLISVNAGMSLTLGALAGLSASGVVTVASRIGNSA